MTDSSDDQNATRASYNHIASAYADHFADEFDHKPLERRLLAEFAANTPGLIADVGCGPGQAAAYLNSWRDSEIVDSMEESPALGTLQHSFSSPL